MLEIKVSPLWQAVVCGVVGRLVALVEFNTIALPLIKQIYSNRAENKRLSLLRDTLLPKLMSGELDVSDIDL